MFKIHGCTGTGLVQAGGKASLSLLLCLKDKLWGTQFFPGSGKLMDSDKRELVLRHAWLGVSICKLHLD